MPERSASSIAFTLLLNVYFFGLAERPVKASPLQWQDRGHYREAKLNRPLGQASGFLLLSAKAAGVEVTWPSGIKSVEQVTTPALLLELGL